MTVESSRVMLNRQGIGTVFFAPEKLLLCCQLKSQAPIADGHETAARRLIRASLHSLKLLQ